MSGVFDHLHIKRHTKGSSNELSFDVLDAASSDLEDSSSPNSRFSSSTLSHRGNYHGVSDRTTLSAKDEVEECKRVRKVHKTVFWLGIGLAVFAAACAMLWAGYAHYLEVQDFTTRYDSLVSQFDEGDNFISTIDSLMATLDDDSTTQARKAAKDEIAQVIANIEKIKANSDSIRPLALGDHETQAIDLLVKSADARIELLEIARKTFETTAERDEKSSEVNIIWNDVVDAAQRAKEASAQANEATTEEATREAIVQTQEALDVMNNALYEIEALEETSPQIDLSAQREYLQQKTASLSYAIETGEALINEDREKAEQLNDLYNQSDRESVKLAKKMPLSPDITIDESYLSLLKDYAQLYDECRDKMVSIDSEVRNVLSNR